MTKRLGKILFILYIIGLIWLILFKISFHPITYLELVNTRSLNLVPFAMSGGSREILYNIIAFIPFGILFGMNAPKWSFLTKVILSFSLSLSFESLQYLLAIGASDITDIITNTLGALIGLSFYALLIKIFAKTKVNIVLISLFCLLLGFVLFFIGQTLFWIYFPQY